MMKKISESIRIYDGSSYGSVCCGLTPQDKKGGTKPPTETTIQAKGSKEKVKKEKMKKTEKKEENVKAEAAVKDAEAPEREAKGPGVGLAQGPGVRETAPKTPAGNAAVKPSAELPKEQTEEKTPKAPEKIKKQETAEKAKLSQKKPDSGLKKKSVEKKSDGKQAKNSGNGEAGQKGKTAA